MFGGYHDGMGGGDWVLMAIFWITLLAVIVWAVVRLVPGRREAGHERREPEPLEILDRRLARGEIDPDEYRQIRSTLGGPTLTGTGGS
jgi:putative membrane protein